MSFIEVRHASSGDATAIENHRVASAHEAANYRGTTDLFDESEFTSQFTVVACIDGEVVGSCSCATIRGDAFVTHIFVDPSARKVGVGDSLMRAVLEHAKSKNHYIKAIALPGDRETKNLFERHGMTAQTIIVGRPLEN